MVNYNNPFIYAFGHIKEKTEEEKSKLLHNFGGFALFQLIACILSIIYWILSGQEQIFSILINIMLFCFLFFQIREANEKTHSSQIEQLSNISSNLQYAYINNEKLLQEVNNSYDAYGMIREIGIFINNFKVCISIHIIILLVKILINIF